MELLLRSNWRLLSDQMEFFLPIELDIIVGLRGVIPAIELDIIIGINGVFSPDQIRSLLPIRL